MPTEIRPFVPADTDEILSLALRLTIGVADWRPASGVAAAAHGWLTSSLNSASEDHPVWVAEADGTASVEISCPGRRSGREVAA